MSGTKQPDRWDDHPVGADGRRACYLCRGTLDGRPFVQLREFIVADGKTGWRLRDYVNREGKRDGPLLHIDVCLHDFVWGQQAEVKHVLRENGQT